MKTEAITKIEDGRKAYKGNRYGQVMAPYVAEILKDFCQQNEEFAQVLGCSADYLLGLSNDQKSYDRRA